MKTFLVLGLYIYIARLINSIYRKYLKIFLVRESHGLTVLLTKIGIGQSNNGVAKIAACLHHPLTSCQAIVRALPEVEHCVIVNLE